MPHGYSILLTYSTICVTTYYLPNASTLPSASLRHQRS